MKITIESTTRVVEIEIGGTRVPGRIWEGQTDSGIPVVCLVTRVAAHKDFPQELFEAELRECKAPTSTAIEAIPLRMIL